MDLISAAAFVRLSVSLNRVSDISIGSVCDSLPHVDYTVHKVWYNGIYGNTGRFVLMREYWYGVWRNHETGTYAVAPKYDDLGRLNGSI